MIGAASLRQRALSSSFVRAVAQSFAVRVAGAVGTLVVTVIVARALGPTGRGAYALAFTVATLAVQFAGLGLHSANVYLTARDRSMASVLFSNSVLVCGALGVVAAGLIVLILTVLSPISLVHGGTLAATIAWVPIGLLFLLIQHVLLGLGDVRSYNAGDLVSKATLVVVVVVVAVLGRGSVVMFISASLIGFVAGLMLFLRVLRRHHVTLTRPSGSVLRASLGYGIRNYITAFFSLALLRADMILVQRYLGERQTGYYSVAVSITDMLFMLPVVIGTLAFARMSAAPTLAQQRHQARQIGIATGAVMLVATGAVALVASPLIAVLFGSAYDPSVTPLLLLLPGVLLLSVNIVFNNHFAATGMPWVMVWLPILAVGLNLGLNTWAIPRFGINGAAITSSICYGVQLVMSLGYLRATAAREPAPA